MWGSVKLHYGLYIYMLNYTGNGQLHTTNSVTFGAKNVTLAPKVESLNDTVCTVGPLTTGYFKNKRVIQCFVK